jgi:hypothetical protein
MNILEKIRNLPESKRKIIFWSGIIIAGLCLASLYFIGIRNNIRNLKSIDFKEELKTPDFTTELGDWPKLEMSEEDLEELKKIEEEIKKNEEEESSTTNKEASTTE